MSTIQNNSDFLFLYEASNCNPNGDPDQENKPRMDYETNTNLVTDTRLKRYIRDFLMQKGEDVFVSMEENAKVSVDSKLKAVVKRTITNKKELEKAFADNPNGLKIYEKIIKDKEGNTDKVLAEIANKDFKHKDVNFGLLAYLVKEKFIDVRMFGSAYAVPGFNKPYTGPIQLNWGYSLNEVFPIESNSIVTTMNDDNSTFGKDYRIHYSLLGFHGIMNKYAAKTTGLSDDDVVVFRDAIWQAIPALPTRSKINQYPKLYLEIIYNEGYNNGHFGDLRNLIKCKPKKEEPINGEPKKVRTFNDLEVDFTDLIYKIKEKKGSVIKDVIVKTSGDLNFNL